VNTSAGINWREQQGRAGTWWDDTGYVIARSPSQGWFRQLTRCSRMRLKLKV